MRTERYPVEGGAFWLHIDKTHGDWVYTLRMKGDWANPIGIEVARLNSMVMARYGTAPARLMVDRLNAEGTGP